MNNIFSPSFSPILARNSQNIPQTNQQTDQFKTLTSMIVESNEKVSNCLYALTNSISEFTKLKETNQQTDENEEYLEEESESLGEKKKKEKKGKKKKEKKKKRKREEKEKGEKEKKKKKRRRKKETSEKIKVDFVLEDKDKNVKYHEKLPFVKPAKELAPQSAVLNVVQTTFTELFKGHEEELKNLQIDEEKNFPFVEGAFFQDLTACFFIPNEDKAIALPKREYWPTIPIPEELQTVFKQVKVNGKPLEWIGLNTFNRGAATTRYALSTMKAGKPYLTDEQKNERGQKACGELKTKMTEILTPDFINGKLNEWQSETNELKRQSLGAKGEKKKGNKNKKKQKKF